MTALLPGISAPQFKLPLAGGGEFSLKQALEKGPVVLAFFKISCPVCQYALPFIDRLAHSLKERGVAVVGISQDDEQNTLLFRRTLGLKLPIAHDDDGYAVSRAYGLTNVPTVFDVATDGRIIASIVGWSKTDIEAIYARYAKGVPHGAPLFAANEEVAEFRPG